MVSAFSALSTRPALTIASEGEHARALRLLQKTQELCLVLRALAISHAFEPHIEVSKAVTSP